MEIVGRWNANRLFQEYKWYVGIYVQRTQKERNWVIKMKGIIDVYMQHDDWCNIFKGGECNCKPDIKIK